MSQSSLGDGLYMSMIGVLPRKRFGRVVRRLTCWEGSSQAARVGVRAFSSAFGLNMDEAEHPLESYPNIHSLFTRRLKHGARVIDSDPKAVVSPVDGVASQFGAIENGLLTQVKGQNYTLEGLLGGASEAEAFQGGQYLTIYLSPRHYHRIHSPADGEVRRFDHIPGQLWPVNGPSVRTVPELFAINERVITYVTTDSGKDIAVIKVGAVGVGHISLAYHDRRSNLPDQDRLAAKLDSPHVVDRGGELAVFELGSTVVVLLPPGLGTFEGFEMGDELKMGQRIATMDLGDAAQ